jgi:hypothetical protein
VSWRSAAARRFGVTPAGHTRAGALGTRPRPARALRSPGPAVYGSSAEPAAPRERVRARRAGGGEVTASPPKPRGGKSATGECSGPGPHHAVRAGAVFARDPAGGPAGSPGPLSAAAGGLGPPAASHVLRCLSRAAATRREASGFSRLPPPRAGEKTTPHLARVPYRGTLPCALMAKVELSPIPFR